MTPTGEAVCFNALVTVILSSFLLRPGLGELPEECLVNKGDRLLEGSGVILQVISCTTSQIEVEYERVGEVRFDNTLSILYTCQHPNGTEIDLFNVSHQLLVESTDSRSGSTLATLDDYWVELAHGTVCDVYTCYTSYEPPDGEFTKLRTTPVTCTVVDIDICNNDCTSRGAIGCQTDTSGSSPEGYGCVCTSGYVWNATHCENVNECNTTDPDHQHDCPADEGYRCLDLEGSFMCINCTDKEEWNGTDCVPLVTEDDELPATVIVSTDSPTTSAYDSDPTKPRTTSTTSTPTAAASSLVSNGVSAATASKVVPTAVGALSFLALLVGLLTGLFSLLICLHRKRNNKNRVYSEMNNYYPGYPCYPGYIDKIDENFNPIDIHPASIDYLSDIFQMSSIASRLNQLGKLEESDANATRTTAPTTQHLNVSTSRPCHLNLSSERSSDVVRLSSNGHHCGPHSIDSCTKQISGEQATEQSVDTVGSSSNLARKGTRDSRDSDNLENMAVTSQPHRCSCVTMESTGSARQTYGRHFRQSSVGTLESEWMHFDLTGSGLTDTSGYITCISTHDHLEEMEQSCT